MSAEIKSFVTPLRLYRYRSIATENAFNRELEAIVTGYIHCADYKSLNDPMEGVFEASRLLLKSKSYDSIREAVAENKGQIGISSFSEVHDHELMWAHYADQFRGICIAYRFSDLLKNLPDRTEFVRMFYNEKMPTVGRTSHRPDQIAKRVLSHKNHRWLYEREWRMFGPKGKAFYTKPASVVRVYLGFRIDPARQKDIEDRLRRVGIKTMIMGIEGYSMSFSRKRA